MMKKILISLIVIALALTVMTACESNNTASTVWECDFNEHWHINAKNGKRTDVGAHKFDEADAFTCTVCGCGLIDWGDEKELFVLNEHEDVIRNVVYDADGKVVSEQTCAFEYDKDGNRISQKCYYNGILSEEKTFAIGKHGEYEAKVIYYEQDGTRTVTEYTESGKITLYEAYDANGRLYLKTLSTYAEDVHGELYESESAEYWYDEDRIYTATYNSYGDQTGRTVCDIDGNLIQTDVFEYGYDEEGNHTWKKAYKDGVLVEEHLSYAFYECEDYTMRFPKTSVNYYEDGTKLVTEYGETGEIETETLYDADGTVISVSEVDTEA